MESLAAGQIESNYDETVDSFDTMNLKPELLRGTVHYTHFGSIGINPEFRCLRLRFRAPVCYPATRDHASHQGSVSSI